MNGRRSLRNRPLVRRAGFTLLEVLLTSLLAAIVLLSLWALSDIYLRLFVTGKRQIEEVQLVRGLTQQLSQDVAQVGIVEPATSDAAMLPTATPLPNPLDAGRSLASSPNSAPRPGGRTNPFTRNAGAPAGTPSPLPPPAALPAATSAAPLIANRSLNSGTTSGLGEAKSILTTPLFGLFGTRQSLRLVIRQADPLAFREPTELSEILPEPGKPRTPFASELRTIEYSFSQPLGVASNEQTHPPGLIRREWAWEIWSARQLANSRSQGTASSAATLMPAEIPEWTPQDALEFEDHENTLHIPQIAALELRYFDGETWETEWNSVERQELPRLVELLFQVDEDADKVRTAEELDESLGSEEVVPLSQQWAAGAAARDASQPMIYRRLIRLPTRETAAPPQWPAVRPAAESTSGSMVTGVRRP